jgi:hypothetical protein
MTGKQGFTLIGLLVEVATIALPVAILLPAQTLYGIPELQGKDSYASFIDGTPREPISCSLISMWDL